MVLLHYFRSISLFFLIDDQIMMVLMEFKKFYVKWMDKADKFLRKFIDDSV